MQLYTHNTSKQELNQQSLEAWYLAKVQHNVLLFNQKQLNLLQELDQFTTWFNTLNNNNANTFTQLIIKIIRNITLWTLHLQPQHKPQPFHHYIKHKNVLPKKTLGYYIYGSVGQGKTMILDQLYKSIITSKKMRVHFHQFMSEIQQQLTSLQQQDNPLKNIATTIAHQYNILFLDEMHVSDIATAMILYNLFINLFNHNVFVIISSNYNPDELYNEGLMRERFIPTIKLIKQQLTVLELNTQQDYRLIKQSQQSSNELFIINQPPLTTLNKLNTIFNHVVKLHNPKHKSHNKNKDEVISNLINHESSEITIQNRQIKFIKCHNNQQNINNSIIWFDFNIICGKNRSQLDYLELVHYFNWFIIQNIYQLTIADSDIAQRFTWLIDILYDNKCKLAISSSTNLSTLYTNKTLTNNFQRTLSRLTEMQVATID